MTNSRVSSQAAGSSTVVPMLQRARGARAGAHRPTIKSVAQPVRGVILLLGGVVSLLLSILTVMFVLQTRTRLSGLIVYFWVCIGLSIPVAVTFKLLHTLLKRRRSRLMKPSSDSMICAVEVCINNEIVLTVRSWWPIEMAIPDAEKNGVRVAVSSAHRWITEHGAKASKIRFSTESATLLSNQYLTKPSIGTHDHCSVCLEHIGNLDEPSQHGGRQMLVCGHVFHEECLAAWFAQSGKLSCPMCRTDHHHLIPEPVLMQYCVNEEPNVAVLTVHVEDGIMPDGTAVH